jgi:hypothetical protein
VQRGRPFISKLANHVNEHQGGCLHDRESVVVLKSGVMCKIIAGGSFSSGPTML